MFTQDEIDLLKKAVSFLNTNKNQAEDELDESLSQDEIDDLESKLYETKEVPK